ncbi:GSCOCT00001566001.2-RA-CDS [Cotesia congregata]|uniref:acid phosphatase n=1 Tax=Cotesia congregata TaxID=51543 RepID=A0A8J2HM26_COTCN|nr:GSCOCT00001566001.2-RA-CDS [Cotesia congregata]CAG5106768.1 Putative venom protein 19 [Cotesia congregata]
MFETKWSVLMFISIFFNISDAKLILIQATMRHGNRYPSERDYAVTYYPNDPYINYTWAPAGPMKLTDKGKQNSLTMGHFLQERYKELIEPVYDKDSVYFRALFEERTINTARLVAVGMFPNSHGNIHWNSSLENITITIDSEEKDKDYLNYAKYMCENYLIDRKNSDVQVQKMFSIFSDVKNFYNYLSEHTGITHLNAYQSYLLYGQFVSESNLGLELEEWTKSIFPNGKLLELSAVEYLLQTWTPRMKRLIGGVWIKNFLNRTQDLLSGKNIQRKGYFYVYSEHHVAAILNALDIYEPHVPHYLSSVIFELHEVDNKYYVKVVHKNEDIIKEVVIKGCESLLCPLDTFKMVLKDVILENFEEDCGRFGHFSHLNVQQ